MSVSQPSPDSREAKVDEMVSKKPTSPNHADMGCFLGCHGWLGRVAVPSLESGEACVTRLAVGLVIPARHGALGAGSVCAPMGTGRGLPGAQGGLERF